MKTILFVFLLVLLFFSKSQLAAQSSLPDFSVKILTPAKTQISWKNPYPNCIQLSVQKSTDSLTNFRTIYSAQSPQLNQNGFVDNRPNPEGKSFYRIFYVLKDMGYFFTYSKNSFTIIKHQPSKPPIQKSLETEETKPKDLLPHSEISKSMPDFQEKTKRNLTTPLSKESKPPSTILPIFDSIKLENLTLKEQWIISPNRPFYFSYLFKNGKKMDSIPQNNLFHFIDSIKQNSKDTLIMYSLDSLIIHPFIPKIIWKPSIYIYTTQQGFPVIQLPMPNSGKYLIKFFEEGGAEIFSMKELSLTDLVLDKSNFMHSGWFYFEIYLADQLLEKNKLWVPKN